MFWGLVVLLQISGNELPVWGTNPLLLQKCLSGEIPSYCVLPPVGRVFWEALSLSLLPTSMWSLYPSLCRTVHLVFRFFSKRNDPCVGVVWALYLEENDSESSSTAGLDPSGRILKLEWGIRKVLEVGVLVLGGRWSILLGLLSKAPTLPHILGDTGTNPSVDYISKRWLLDPWERYS